MCATPHRGMAHPSGFSAVGALGSPPDRSGPSSPSAAGGPGIWPCWRTGCRSFEIGDRSSYVIPGSCVRCRNRRRTYWERHSSFLFFSPYFFRSSFSALIRSASQGWEGRSNFARENFGSPNDSHLRFRLLLLFLLFLLRTGAGFLRLLRLGGGE